MTPVFISGLDLGQAQDYTALAVLEKTQRPDPDTDGRLANYYVVRHLERLPLGTAYTAVGTRLALLFAKPRLVGSVLAVDQTGIGRPVVDMLRRSQIQATIRAITITGGYQAGRDAQGGALVPKKELVSTLQVLLQARRIQVAGKLPEAATLVRELLNFRVKITPTAHETFGAGRESDHDDLVMAVALAAWEAEHYRQFNLFA
jgi:hypothetical protein